MIDIRSVTSIKFISPLFSDIYTRKIIVYKGTRLKCLYLIHLIDLFLNRFNSFNKDNIKLNSRVLKFLYGGTYTKYIEYLTDHQFIYLYKNYSAGLKSKTYRLTETAKQACNLTTTIDIPIKFQIKTQDVDENFNDNDTNLKTKLINDLRLVTIDIRGAQQWINEHIHKEDKGYTMNLINCNKIAVGDIYYSFDRYGRFHTNYTVLKKEIRTQYLTFGESKIKELDITNSQPFFLYILMKESGFSNFQGFDEDVLNGVIYDKIKDVAQITRKEAKVKVYSVLFGRNTTNTYWNELFGNLYPAVFKWIKDYKYENKSYKIIARNLQAIESDFIFGNLIPKILDYKVDLPLITIHDSIMIPEEHYECVKVIFNKALRGLIL